MIRTATWTACVGPGKPRASGDDPVAHVVTDGAQA